jgi:hypothetical protein
MILISHLAVKCLFYNLDILSIDLKLYVLSNDSPQPLPQGFPWGLKTANNTNPCKFASSKSHQLRRRD